jgi:UDP-N-acetylglucosamine acyltransferase
MQGGSGISKDLPPFCIARGDNGIAGLNVIGLRRAGFTQPQRLELRQVYHALFRSRDRLRPSIERARERFHQPASQELIEFTANSKRGVCSDAGSRMAHED